MTGPELAAIRKKLGLSTAQLGRALGYTGEDAVVAGTLRKLESGHRPIPPAIARLATMYARHGIPDGWAHGPPPGKPGPKPKNN